MEIKFNVNQAIYDSLAFCVSPLASFKNPLLNVLNDVCLTLKEPNDIYFISRTKRFSASKTF